MRQNKDVTQNLMVSPGLRDQMIRDLEALPSLETTDADPVHFDREEISQAVQKRIDHHFGGNTASDFLVEQLMELEANLFVTILGQKHPYRPFTIYHRIEDVAQGRRRGKRFRKKNSPLNARDLRHIHHSESHYLDFNFVEFFKREYPNDASIANRLSEIHASGRVPQEKLLSSLASETLIRSVGDNPKKTGQWLIYQEVPEGFHFVCLWLHTKGIDGDQHLFETIEQYLV